MSDYGVQHERAMHHAELMREIGSSLFEGDKFTTSVHLWEDGDYKICVRGDDPRTDNAVELVYHTNRYDGNVMYVEKSDTTAASGTVVDRYPLAISL